MSVYIFECIRHLNIILPHHHHPTPPLPTTFFPSLLNRIHTEFNLIWTLCEISNKGVFFIMIQMIHSFLQSCNKVKKQSFNSFFGNGGSYGFFSSFFSFMLPNFRFSLLLPVFVSILLLYVSILRAHLTIVTPFIGFHIKFLVFVKNGHSTVLFKNI